MDETTVDGQGCKTMMMTWPVIRVGLAVCVIFFQFCSMACAWEGKVIRIQDGDSFQVRQGRHLQTVRLYGIDCPEYQQPGGQRAKKLTSSLVKGRLVEIIPMDTDRYGRVVAVVRFGGMVLNAELVRLGLAWVYPRYCTSPTWCRQWQALEQEARRARLGIWREAHPEPPWRSRSKGDNQY